MLIPINWLKEYVNINLPLKDLMWKLTEAGLTCETVKKINGEDVLDVEVTANRPDWMSVMGVAREAAAIQGIKVKEPKIQSLPTPSKTLPIKLIPDFELFERWSGVIISGIKVGESPAWLKQKLLSINARPINSIVDITNFIMYEYGIPMHAFDYDAIKGSVMKVVKAQGSEEFTSVDEISYKLPKDAIIIKDTERIIDLAGIKGGLNSGINASTKNIFLHVTINNPVFIRRASIALGLRSEASAIYERGPDKGGVVKVLTRAANLVLDNAGGVVASDIIDLCPAKRDLALPGKVQLSFEKLEKVLGIKIEDKKVIQILKSLNLSPKKSKTGVVCAIPTYRADIKIEEDLIEEVARIYGYNQFPKTLPKGVIASQKIPYYFDDHFHNRVRELLITSGFSEAMTLSLISTDLIENCLLDPEKHITITNPVSIDYEHMRTSLIPSLLIGIKPNQGEVIKLFELDKIFPEEIYKISGVVKGETFREFRGAIDLLLERLNIKDYKVEFETPTGFWHPNKSGSIKVGKENLGCFGEISPQVLSNLGIKDTIFAFEFDARLLEKYSQKAVFKPVSEFPPQIEDLTLTFPPKTRVGEVIKLIPNSELIDIYKDSYTFRVWYQDPKKTLTDEEVSKIRKGILDRIKSKFGGTIKN